MKRKNIDLTQGNIASVLIAFAIPLFIGQLFQTLYHSVDSIVVGNFVSSDALAAVNASTSISNTLVGFFTGLSAGVGVVFARHFGARDYDRLHESIQTTVTFTLISGTIIALIGIIFSKDFLTLLKVDPDIIEPAAAYMRIYMFGVLFTAIYNVGASIVRSIGNSLSPFYHLVVSSLANIVLDLLFVAVFHMGVNGVGYATVIAQLISVVLVFIRMQKMDEKYALDLKDLHVSFPVLGEVLSLGLPAAIQSSITSIANIFTHRYINSFGKAATAGLPTGQKIDQFAQLAAKGVGMAIPTFIAQNIGAKKYDRAIKGVTVSIILVMSLTIIPGFAVYFLARPLARIFTPDEAVIEVIVGFLHTVMPLYGFMGLHQVFSGINKGFHKATFDMANNLFSMVFIRQLWLAVTLKANHVIQNIFWCYPLTWACAGIIGFLYYEIVVKKEVRILLAEGKEELSI
ncbi:MAG: MATE family efflux transporter [Erysipelotrichaceae bacterium]|nr:MATE family efflux transporter [Erysipelotrichaceae bacterium]